MRARRFSERVSAGFLGSALGETIAVAVHFEDTAMVGDTIQRCAGRPLGRDCQEFRVRWA